MPGLTQCTVLLEQESEKNVVPIIEYSCVLAPIHHSLLAQTSNGSSEPPSYLGWCTGTSYGSSGLRGRPKLAVCH